jgi:hypothetical protein
MKITNHINYLLIVAIVLLTSCSGLLDVEQQNSTSPEGFIKDRQTASNALASVYVSARRALAEEGALFAYTDLRTGHLKMNSATGIQIANQNLLYTTKELKDYRNWDDFLESIYQCNLLIENIDNTERFLTEDDINSHKGQAYFMRALLDFYMCQIWGDVPLIKSTSARVNASRSEKALVMESVIADALVAIDMLPMTHTDNSGNVNYLNTSTYASKTAAIILLVKAYVHTGNDSEAIKWYESLLLLTRSNVVLEDAFEFSLEGNDYTSDIDNLFSEDVFFNGKDQSLMEVTSGEYVLSLYDEEDQRLVKGFEVVDDQVILLKHDDSSLDILGLKEVKLLAAEAYAKSGMDDKALGIVNANRVMNGLGEIFDISGDDLLYEIMMEFEREFFGDGKLFFDWSRWGILADKVPTISVEQFESGINLWPISDQNFKENSALVQNPFWLN